MQRSGFVALSWAMASEMWKSLQSGGMGRVRTPYCMVSALIFFGSKPCELWLRSGVGACKRSRSERNEVSEAAQPERRRQLQTEAAARAVIPTDAARDERVVCEEERAWSRGRRGRPAARGAQ